MLSRPRPWSNPLPAGLPSPSFPSSPSPLTGLDSRGALRRDWRRCPIWCLAKGYGKCGGALHCWGLNMFERSEFFALRVEGSESWPEPSRCSHLTFRELPSQLGFARCKCNGSTAKSAEAAEVTRQRALLLSHAAQVRWACVSKQERETKNECKMVSFSSRSKSRSINIKIHMRM